MKHTTLLLLILVLFLIQGASYAATETTSPQAPANTAICDLGAEMINFEIVKQLDEKNVRVRIIAMVKNLGNTDFHCGEKQTTAILYEGSRTPENAYAKVAEKEIRSIPPGEFFIFSYELDWEIADLEKFGSQPLYKLELIFAPELLQDGDIANDDKVAKNNKRERTTKELRRIWAASQTGKTPQTH